MVHFLETLNTEGHVMAINPAVIHSELFLAKVGEAAAL